jgi:hypothetical protein
VQGSKKTNDQSKAVKFKRKQIVPGVKMERIFFIWGNADIGILTFT